MFCEVHIVYYISRWISMYWIIAACKKQLIDNLFLLVIKIIQWVRKINVHSCQSYKRSTLHYNAYFLYFYNFFYKKMLHTRAIVYQRSYFCTSLCPWARPSIRLSILVSISAIQLCTGSYLLKLLSHILVMVMPQMYLN